MELNNFLFSRYSTRPIVNDAPTVNVDTISQPINKIIKMTPEQEFEMLLKQTEEKNGRKYTRNERREMYRNFLKNKKRKK